LLDSEERPCAKVGVPRVRSEREVPNACLSDNGGECARLLLRDAVLVEHELLDVVERGTFVCVEACPPVCDGPAVDVRDLGAADVAEARLDDPIGLPEGHAPEVVRPRLGRERVEVGLESQPGHGSSVARLREDVKVRMPMEYPLAAQVALVTGAGGGIGGATAEQLAGAGALVVVVDVDSGGADATVSRITGAGGAAEARIVDLTDLGALPGLVEDIVGRHGRIDILVNAAGITGHPEPTGFFETSAATWERVFLVDAQAPFLLMQLVGERMIAARSGGRIVNVTSSSAFRAKALPAYSAAKAALGQLTRTAAVVLAPHGVTVNNVAPGLTRTKIVEGLRDDLEAAVREGPNANLNHRVGEPEDVAAAVLFLCLPTSRQVIAQTIHTSAGAIV
jgi:NAD(P)-dependent dehydrogenase (short-subunit alcohol dehydrogenase family)